MEEASIDQSQQQVQSTAEQTVQKRNLKWIVVLCLLVVALSGSVGYFFTLSTQQNKSETAIKKVYHVGVLSGIPIFDSITDVFKQRMTKLGYIEGENIVYDIQLANGDPMVSQKAINKFVADNVDLIVASPTEPALYAKKVTKEKTIPVVFIGDTEGTDIVNSIQQPGGNITGIRMGSPEKTAKRLQLMREMAPHIKKVYLPYDPNYPTTDATLNFVRNEATAFSITLVEVPVASPDVLLADIAKRDKVASPGIDAILEMPSVLTTIPTVRAAFVQLATNHKLVIDSPGVMVPESVSLFSYFPDSSSMGNMAAVLVDKIFKGTSAGTLPVVTAEASFTLNYRQAQALGLQISEGTLGKADQIIR